MFLINLYAIFVDNTLADFPFKLFYTTYCTIGVTYAVLAKIRESLHVCCITTRICLATTSQSCCVWLTLLYIESLC